jgi:uncharacterized protein
VKLHVDAWDPAYGSGFEPGESGGGPGGESTAQLAPDVELAPDAWRPISAPAGAARPSVVLLVDGVRRIDARVWIVDDDGSVHQGLAASYAAGVVRCDLRAGAAEVAPPRVEHGLFTSSREAEDVIAGSVRYVVRRAGRDDFKVLIGGIQARLQAMEAEAAMAARATAAGTEDDLLVVDGPLRGRAHLPRALGYVKTHRVEYLPPELSTVVGALGAGQRCPVFLLGTNWHRYTWYLRLPGPAGSPWSGVVRVECSADLTPAAAIALANLSASVLPRFASTPYKDPRAPQNLVPIAGLERRLRSLLGDGRLLHRALTMAARGSAPAAAR